MANDPEDGSGDLTDEGAERERWAAIHRFLDDLSPLLEQRLVEHLIADDPQVQQYIKAHAAVWSMIAERLGTDPIDPEDAWASLQRRIVEHGGGATSASVANPNISARDRWAPRYRP